MSLGKTKCFSTRLSSIKEQKWPTTMESNQFIHFELNEKGQKILPFSRRVISMNVPWLIKQPHSSSMINHGQQGHNIEVNANRQEKSEDIKEKYLNIIDKRIGNRYVDSYDQCPTDIFGNADMSDPRAWHRLYDDDYYYDQYDDDDNDDDSIVEGQQLLDQFIEDYTKSCWARYGKSTPKKFINPFEIYD